MFSEAVWEPPFSCVVSEHDTTRNGEQMTGGFTDRAKTVFFAVLLDEFTQFRLNYAGETNTRRHVGRRGWCSHLV